MTIATLWRLTIWLDLPEPTVSLRVEYAQHAMVFFSVVASEDVQFLLE